MRCTKDAIQYSFNSFYKYNRQMQRKKFFVLVFLFLLLQLGGCASRFKKGGSFGSRRIDGDGFGSFGKVRHRDSDGYYKKSSTNDDQFFIRTSGKYSRRVNMYAGKKLEEFGDNAGKGMTSFVYRLFGIKSQQMKVMTGKKVKSNLDPRLYNHQLAYDWLSNTIVCLSVIIGIVLICWVIKSDLFSQTQEEKMIRQAKVRYKETFKNYQILNHIKEHGVHPDRATGRIYKIKI